MAAGRLVLPQWMPAIDSDGIPLPNAEAFFYQNKTTILATIYADEDLTTALPNPVAANSSGRFPAIWADDGSLYSATVTADYAPQGTPFTFDDLRPSQAADAVIADQAEAAAAQAAIDAASAAQSLAEIQDIAANAPDAPSVANKANRDLDNVTTADFSAKALIPTGGDTAVGLGVSVPLYASALNAVPNTYDAIAAALNVLALNKTIPPNYVLDGKNETYAIDGRWTATVNPSLQNMRFRQIATTGTERAKTIDFNGRSTVYLKNVVLDLNNIQAPAGVLFSEAHGIRIINCGLVILDNVRVINGGGHTGIWVESCTKVIERNCQVTDFNAISALEPTDDLCQGIYYVDCDDVDSDGAYIDNLSSSWVGQPIPRRLYSRGFVMNGCTNARISRPYASRVDQGIDLTGADNNSILLSDFRTNECSTFGAKVANRGNHLRIQGGLAYRSGWAGVVVSSQVAGSVTVQSQNIDIDGVTVINTGWNGLYSAADSRNSFQIISTNYAGTESYPAGVTFSNCSSYDNQATRTVDVHYAVRGTMTPTGPTSTIPPNRLVNCRSFSVAGGGTFQSGFNFPIAKAGGNTTQSTTNGVDTLLLWNTDLDDSSNLVDAATGRFYAKERGRYLVTGVVEFVANATGRRELAIYKNGAITSNRDRARAMPDASVNTRLEINRTVTLAVGDYIDLRAYQNSSTPLAVDLNVSFCEIVKIADA